jgi:hypothetical protein
MNKHHSVVVQHLNQRLAKVDNGRRESRVVIQMCMTFREDKSVLKLNSSQGAPRADHPLQDGIDSLTGRRI